MHIYLAKNVQVPLGVADNQVMSMEQNPSHETIRVRRSHAIPYTMAPVDVNRMDKITTLKTKLQQYSSSLQSQTNGQVAEPWQMAVDVGVSLQTTNPDTSLEIIKGFIGVRDCSSKGILQAICQIYGQGEVKLTVQVESLKYSFQGNTTADSIWSNLINISGQPVMHIPSSNSYGIKKSQVDFCGEGNIIGLNEWKRVFCDSDRGGGWEATITIIALVPDELSEMGADIPNKLSINKKLLQEQVFTDVTIISRDGVGVKCHKAILGVQSSVLATMFQTATYEGPTGTIVEMPEMSEASVRAFLAFLYYQETKDAECDSRICFELCGAGRRYDINTLENWMMDILLLKNSAWYDADVALKLFLFSKTLPNGNQLKMKAAQVLKLKRFDLTSSVAYQQLFREHPDDAMDLCNTLHFV